MDPFRGILADKRVRFSHRGHETNACVIELYADGELADAFDTLVPVKLTAEQLRNAIKFSNVMDVETQHMGKIRVTDEVPQG